MLNILMMSPEMAKKIMTQWHGVSLYVCQFATFWVALFLILIGLLGVTSTLGDIKKIKFVVTFIFMMIVGIGLFSVLIFSQNSATANENVAKGVIDYHKMIHLRKIYPKLPSKLDVEYKARSPKSLLKASKKKQMAKRTFTKDKAIKKYNKLSRKYHIVKKHCDIKNLKPRPPRWYDYI